MKIEIDLGEIIGQAKNIEQDDMHRFVTDDEKQKWNDAYDHSEEAHAPANAEANVQADWNESNSTSDSYIKNKPTMMSLGTIYEGNISGAKSYQLETSMLGFSYAEFLGKDADGSCWSEKINPIDFIGGMQFSIHGIKFTGINSGPNLVVTQNSTGASIYKIIGVKA